MGSVELVGNTKAYTVPSFALTPFQMEFSSDQSNEEKVCTTFKYQPDGTLRTKLANYMMHQNTHPVNLIGDFAISLCDQRARLLLSHP